MKHATAAWIETSLRAVLPVLGELAIAGGHQCRSIIGEFLCSGCAAATKIGRDAKCGGTAIGFDLARTTNFAGYGAR